MKQHLVGAVIAAVLLGAPAAPQFGTEAQASILPQIDTAQELAAGGLSHSEALRKHYVEVAPGVYQAVKGARERRQIRFARWHSMLSADRAAIYATHGHPVFRHQELSGGIVREFWSYPKQRRTYVFEGNALVAERWF